jgi:CRP-like cAMP-binding protein
MQPGEPLGEMGLLTGQPRTANAVAKTNLTLFKIGQLGFDEITAENQKIRETIWLTYSWHVFDNFQRKSTFPRLLSKKERQAWFSRHFTQTLAVGQKVNVPQSGAYAFVLMGSLRIGAETYNSPSLAPVTNIKEVLANKNARILWLPTL